MGLKPHFPGASRSFPCLKSHHWRAIRRQLPGQSSTQTRSKSLAAAPSSRNNGKPEISIGVIGGGISGLSTAYHILQKWKHMDQLKPVKVTLYEQSDQLGGWLQSKKIPVGKHGDYIRVESGPRTLSTSPISRLTLEMIEEIGIKDSIRWVRKDAPAAQKRYLYLGGDDLYRFPSDPGGVVEDYFAATSQMRPVIHSALAAWLRNAPLWLLEQDLPAGELSLGEQMSSHLGHYFTANLLSAFVHGIYAGDVWELSALARGPWQAVFASLSVGTRKQPKLDVLLDDQTLFPDESLQHQAYMEVFQTSKFPDVRHSWVFYFKEGMGLLSLALESHLRMNYGKELTIRTRTDVDAVSMGDDCIVISGREGSRTFEDEHDYVVSAVPPATAMQILEPAPPWKDVQAVTVGSVTLFWEDQQPIEYDGFGYIISGECPPDKNPDGALGVIFDSSSRPEQGRASGQKVTVLLGGKYWEPGLRNHHPLPTSEQLIQQARQTLEIQLGVTAEPTISHAEIQHCAIPQPTVDFMKSINSEFNPPVQEWADHWQDRLFLTGPPVTGPGVHDSIMGGYQVATNLMAHAWLQQNADVGGQAFNEELLHLAGHRPGGDEDVANQTAAMREDEYTAHHARLTTKAEVLTSTRQGACGIVTGMNPLWPAGISPHWQKW